MKKVRVGFIGYNDMSWTGGVNYLKNLLHAIGKLDNKNIEPYVFFRKSANPVIVSEFRDLANCIFLDFDTFQTFILKVFSKVTLRETLLDYYLKKHEIDVISHIQFSLSGISKKKIGWIPDFQHIHLPELFSKEELKLRDENFRRILLKTDCTIVSSSNAFNDCVAFEKSAEKKIRKLNFVAQINSEIYKSESNNIDKFRESLGIRGRYFFLPNQFWIHKNHMVVFNAMAILIARGVSVSLVCSGNTTAFGKEDYFETLKKNLNNLQIEDNVILLGRINYLDVLLLMRHSISVINPSFFEGWSSTVEECRSLGKNMLLSDIPVHREQNPPETIYFDPRSPAELAEKMQMKLDKYNGGPDFYLEETARMNLISRTLEYARNYESIILEILR